MEEGVKNRVAAPAPKAKRTKRAGSKSLGPVVTLQAHYTDAEEVDLTSNDEVSQKLDALPKAVTDLSRHIEAMEEHQEKGRASPSSNSSTSFS